MVLALLAVTLFGVLGGLGASLILPVHYQAEAYVVVYAMPRGFTSLISPTKRFLYKTSTGRECSRTQC